MFWFPLFSPKAVVNSFYRGLQPILHNSYAWNREFILWRNLTIFLPNLYILKVFHYYQHSTTMTTIIIIVN